jgi:hypothetical protein
MNVVLTNLTGELCFVFIDDILVYADTIEEHARRLDEVLQRFEKANLLFQSGKCTLALPQVNYLDYVVSRDGVTAYPEEVLAVRKYPVPKNVKEVRSFLGFTSFYRMLVPRFAEFAKPMTPLIRKDTYFNWESSQQAAFEKLKDVICSEHVLAYPDFKSQFILTTDASKVAVAAAYRKSKMASRARSLLQATDESGIAKLLCFRSRNSRSNMGKKAVSLLPLWEVIRR